MVPHEKEMVQRLKDKPFALIGVNSDGGRSALKKIMTEQGITWRSFVNGDTSGPISTRWNVSGWPTTYLIDKKGIIRAKQLRDKQLEDEVVKLLAEK